jgi:hypothetical protein
VLIVAVFSVVNIHRNLQIIIRCEGFITNKEVGELLLQQHTILNNEKNLLVVQDEDSIYRKGSLPPVVIEEFKLIFFTTEGRMHSLESSIALRSSRSAGFISCQNMSDSFSIYDRALSTHDEIQQLERGGKQKDATGNPTTNGLKYFLYDYNRETASQIMTSKNWTRAIFVRGSGSGQGRTSGRYLCSRQVLPINRRLREISSGILARLSEPGKHLRGQ